MEITALSYVVVKSVDLKVWTRFAESVIGMRADRLDAGLALRMDERAGRIFVESAETDLYFASGWEVRSEAEFARALCELDAAGVAYHRASASEISFRHVFDMVWFLDPSGNRHEIAYGYVTSFERFTSPVGVPRFVTGPLGLGHTVLPAPNIAQTRAFFIDVLGFGLADILIHRPDGPGGERTQRIDFLHCANGRHHSLALFEGEVPSGCVHLMVEVESMDEVGRAYDRMLSGETRLMATLGKHTNDHMTSFYFNSPSNFAVEFGYGGRVVDWERHSLFESTSVSLWGHDFSVGFNAAP